MSISENLAHYKNGFEAALAAGDGQAALANAVTYANLLRQIAKPPVSYTDCAFLKMTADRYDYAAAIIKVAAYKIDAKTLATVRACIERGEIPFKKPPEPKKTAPAAAAAPAPAPKAAPAQAPKRTPAKKNTAATEAPVLIGPAPLSPPCDDPLGRILASIGGPATPAEPKKTEPAPAAKKAAPQAPATADPAFAGILSQLGIGAAPAPAPAAKAAPAPTPAPRPAAPSAPGTHVFEGSEWSADVFEKFLPAVVVVRSDDGVGTGFFFRNDGYILTNHHVAYLDNGEPSSSLRIESGDKAIRGKAKLLHADKTHDVALLKLDRSGPTPFIPLEEDYTKVRPGIEITIIGNALNFGLAPINGTVKFADRSGNIVYTAPTNHGDSGSPVISRDGKAVGIHKSSTTQAKGLSNGTPASDILELLSTWLKGV